MDPDADPYIFITDLEDANKKLIFKKKFSCILLFEGTYTSFSKIKVKKMSQNSRKQGFSYYFRIRIQSRIRIRAHTSD
jgi:hypothetical protein